ncbi:MAG: RNA methyltransferase [Clostridia bacterium]|nr:RNA methyltransferase [Clostridia bacterium]
MEQIISVKNEYIKELCRLNTAAGRRESGLFLVEGSKLCEEAVKSGWSVEKCLATDREIRNPLLASFETIRISDAVAGKLSSMDTTPGLFMVVKQQNRPVSEAPFILALDHLADPGNLGAVLRSAEAFGVKQVFLSNGSVDLYSPKVLRGAMGSAFRVPVQKGDLPAFLKEKRASGYQILGAGLDRNYHLLPEISFKEPTVMIIGNESGGISAETIELCDKGVFIPMKGQNESLNAAVAASIILWEQSKWN